MIERGKELIHWGLVMVVSGAILAILAVTSKALPMVVTFGSVSVATLLVGVSLWRSGARMFREFTTVARRRVLQGLSFKLECWTAKGMDVSDSDRNRFVELVRHKADAMGLREVMVQGETLPPSGVYLGYQLNLAEGVFELGWVSVYFDGESCGVSGSSITGSLEELAVNLLDIAAGAVEKKRKEGGNS